MDDKGSSRRTEFQRNSSLENLLNDLNSNLWTAEQNILQTGEQPAFPVVLVMGPLRSGTTLLMQWLANTGIFCYPTNLLSRFYGAPIIGAKIQLLLTDPRYNFRDELADFRRQVEFSSENGKTKGALAPNEFWYFWRRFLPVHGQDVWADQELRAGFDSQGMLSELAGIMRVFEKPFAAKGMLFNYNISFLNELLAKVIFIQLKRDPLANIESVLLARERQLGDRAKWYSFEIPEFNSLRDLDPISQAAAQVACINRAIDKGLDSVADERKILLSYEDFCKQPQEKFNIIIDRLGDQGYISEQHFWSDFAFAPANHNLLSPEETRLALKVYGQFMAETN